MPLAGQPDNTEVLEDDPALRSLPGTGATLPLFLPRARVPCAEEAPSAPGLADHPVGTGLIFPPAELALFFLAAWGIASFSVL